MHLLDTILACASSDAEGSDIKAGLGRMSRCCSGRFFQISPLTINLLFLASDFDSQLVFSGILFLSLILGNIIVCLNRYSKMVLLIIFINVFNCLPLSCLVSLSVLDRQFDVPKQFELEFIYSSGSIRRVCTIIIKPSYQTRVGMEESGPSKILEIPVVQNLATTKLNIPAM